MAEQMCVGVVGAGTMGAGIALVALQSGCRVVLCDVQSSVLDRAEAELQKRINRKIEKGELTDEEADRLWQRLLRTTEMSELASANLVIEAVPERMELKQEIFRQLDEVCSEHAILASNTSSLSVTVIAAATKKPERVVGLHFFNPAPVMRLVEVVVGDETAAETVTSAVSWAERFGKQPAVCKDTPGFIVNRVARNFYGEALRIAGEGTASPAVIDQLMHGNAQFPLGPFQLMDMIGIDVNFDVTRSVYEAFHGEPRYRPHPLQERKVATGQLGRKSGRGFYRYEPSTSTHPSTAELSSAPFQRAVVPLEQVFVVGDTPLAGALTARLAALTNRSAEPCGLCYPYPVFEWSEAARAARCEAITERLRRVNPSVVLVSLAGDPVSQRQMLQAMEDGLSEQALILTSLAGPAATEQASWLELPDRLRGFCTVLPLPADQAVDTDAVSETTGPRATVAWTRPMQAGPTPESALVDERAQAVLFAMGWHPVEVRDGAGGVVMRVLAMVLNEAVEALREGIAEASDLDSAMRLGTSYPHGPIAWLQQVGIASVWQTMNALWRELGDDRYRPSPLLHHWWYARGQGIPVSIQRTGGRTDA